MFFKRGQQDPAAKPSDSMNSAAPTPHPLAVSELRSVLEAQREAPASTGPCIG